MEFAALDDDLFTGERQRNNVDEEYSARFCNSCWFLDASPDMLVSDEDRLSVQKHSADYLYFKKDYEAAIAKYGDILSILPQGNTTVRRECYEGIARSHMKTGHFSEGFVYALKLHATSKTIEQNTTSCPVVVDAGIASGNYPEALKAAQLFVSLHPFNSSAWYKLARCYACLYGIQLSSNEELKLVSDNEIPTVNNASRGNGTTDSGDKLSINETCGGKCKTDTIVNSCNSDCVDVNKDVHYKLKSKLLNAPFSLKNIRMNTEDSESGDCNNVNYWKFIIKNPVACTDEEKGTMFVCACLHRSFVMLKRTESTTFGFALDSSKTWQKILWTDMNAVLDENSLGFIRCAVDLNDDIYSNNSPLKESSSEFVDRGSSKFRNNEMEGNIEVMSRESFERQWFKWII